MPQGFVSRAPRVALQPLHDLDIVVGGQRIKVLNVSTTGVGALVASFPQPPPLKGIELPARIRIASNTFDTDLKIAHITGQFIGAAYLKPANDFVQALHQYFDAEMAAMDFVRIDPSLLKSEADGAPYWYQGLNNSGLFYVVDSKGTPLRFTLEFFGNRVEADRDGKPRFGYHAALPDADRLAYESSTAMKWANEWPESSVSLGLRVLRAIADLEPNVAKFIEHSLRQIPVAKPR